MAHGVVDLMIAMVTLNSALLILLR